MATEIDPRLRDDALQPPPEQPVQGVDRGGLSGAGRALGVALPIVLLVVAGVLRFAGLGEPDRIYFDETYYAQDAYSYLFYGVEYDTAATPPGPRFVVHPPVGKWLLAAGIEVFGYDSFGWRAGAAAAGTIAVPILYLVGLRLFRRRGIAALAALLLTVDGLAFTMSRIAMLDIFLMLFVTLGLLFLLVDRDRQWALVAALPDDPDGGRELPRWPHPWRWAAGLAFGLALATKWSALTAIAAAGLFVLVSELAWRYRLTGSPWTQSWRIVVSGLSTLVAVPLLVYGLSYSAWFANFEDTRPGAERCPDEVCAGVTLTGMADAWWDEQVAIANFHRNLDAEHPYRAPALTWFGMTRPVAYYWEGCDAEPAPDEEPCDVAVGNVAHIVGLGNPMIWWPALLTYPVVGWFAVVRRDWRAATILAFLVLQAAPWHLTARPVFLFYMTPAVPFICLSLAYVAWRALAQRSLRWVPAAIAAAAVTAFLFFHPVLVGTEMGRGVWDLRMWIPTWV